MYEGFVHVDIYVDISLLKVCYWIFAKPHKSLEAVTNELGIEPLIDPSPTTMW